MIKLNDVRIGRRLNIVLSTTIVLLLSAFGVYTYNAQMNSYLQEADVAMREEVGDLALFVEQQLQLNAADGEEAKKVNLDHVKTLFKKKKYYKLGYPYVVDKNGQALIHPTKEGSNFSEFGFFKQMITSTELVGKSEYMWEGEAKIQYFKFVESLDAFVSVTFYERDLKEKVRKSINSLVVVILLLNAIFILINWLISRSITKALKKSVSFAENIAKGDLTATLEINQKDEIGQLAKALQDMKAKLTEIIDEVIEGSSQIAAASEELSSSSTEQAASTEEVSSSMEQMIASIQQNADNALQTETIANKAALEIEKGYNSVTQTVTSMREIADKISVIEEIAEKTDLLAINAAIEAARAGEHGKGFAVVAMEVRKLAERSQLAAAEINHVSRSSVAIAEETGTKMGEIVPEIKKTSTLVQEIAASSKEQNAGADQVNMALQQLNQINQSNAAGSEELASQAASLKETTDYFKVEYKKKSVVKKQHVMPKTNGGYTPKLNMFHEEKTDDEFIKI